MPVGLGFLSAFLDWLRAPYVWWEDVSDYMGEIVADPKDAAHVEVRLQNAWGSQQTGMNARATYGTCKFWNGVTIEWEALVDWQGNSNGIERMGGLYLNRRIAASDFHIAVEMSGTGTVYLFTKNRGNESYVNITGAVTDWSQKHKFKLHWETNVEYPPDGRVRLWIDGDLVTTMTTNIPNVAELQFAVGVSSNRLDAMSIPRVELFSFKEI